MKDHTPRHPDMIQRAPAMVNENKNEFRSIAGAVPWTSPLIGPLTKLRLSWRALSALLRSSHLNLYQTKVCLKRAWGRSPPLCKPLRSVAVFIELWKSHYPKHCACADRRPDPTSPQVSILEAPNAPRLLAFEHLPLRLRNGQRRNPGVACDYIYTCTYIGCPVGETMH